MFDILLCLPEDLKRFREMIQNLAAVLGDEYKIFDTNAGVAGDIDAGFNGEDHAGRCKGLVYGRDIAELMLGKADEMAEAVIEIRAETGFGDQVSCG